ncbi:cobalt-precorrin-6A reductase [Xanthobacter sp. DSM 24535]|uniref:cobalt-precorrin-6A reductase n=1 Tax=Roseixanthobacter psychrophilus TaxID=3119917 RepID=UPI00372C2C5F
MTRPILILGGTQDARQLAARLADRPDLSVLLSLAGRTEHPAPQPVPVRSGGFGGAEGLADFLRTHGTCAVIDATHPYAANISRNAASACAATGVPLLALGRPAWEAQEGDRWREVPDVAAAVDALGAAPRRVFLALGRNEVRAFEAAPQHAYVVRSVDSITPPLAVPTAEYILARGPFTEADDRTLLAARSIDIIVAKNSGGTATYGKIAAARALGIEVVMLRRPPLPDVARVSDADAAVAWLDARLHPAARAERGE